MSLELSKPQRLALKKQAHHLKPVVQTGAAGLTEAVIAEIDRALFDHELLKIKLNSDDRASRRDEIMQICEQLDAVCIQKIGHTATLYRPRPAE